MTKRITVKWSDLPEGVTAYDSLHGQERAVRRQRHGLDTMLVSRVRPYGDHHWDDINRVQYETVYDPETKTVEIDATEG